MHMCAWHWLCIQARVTNPTPAPNDDRRRQPPEDVLNRISGVPRTAEEQEADLAQHQQEAKRQAQRTAGVNLDQPAQTTNLPDQRPQPHTETERQQRDKS